MLCVTNVQKNFGDLRAVDGMSLRGAGKVICLLGAKGASKTTMMDLYQGLLEADGGDIGVDGLVCFVQASRAKEAIAYILEKVALYPGMTSLGNLAFFAIFSGNPRSYEELMLLLAESGLQKRVVPKLVRSCSKGMR